jgi:sister-chromatid-cohesion protein PDS5
MLDVLCPLVSECDTVSNDLLNIILVNIVEPVKTAKKNTYHLAKELIIKCAETLEPYIQNVRHIHHTPSPLSQSTFPAQSHFN